ncbi:hypothetical protein HMI55_005603 [Coelomomyces lativittatus]|nr:hypothetical protein HMI55_005603 [Coelomomyces lativittatus]
MKNSLRIILIFFFIILPVTCDVNITTEYLSNGEKIVKAFKDGKQVFVKDPKRLLHLPGIDDFYCDEDDYDFDEYDVDNDVEGDVGDYTIDKGKPPKVPSPDLEPPKKEI